MTVNRGGQDFDGSGHGESQEDPSGSGGDEASSQSGEETYGGSDDSSGDQPALEDTGRPLTDARVGG